MIQAMTIELDPRDTAEIKAMLRRLDKSETAKATTRAINRTMVGVRTDGTKMLKDHYNLTASEIRASWKIRRAAFSNPAGVVSTSGTFLRLKHFSAKQTVTGVSVKVFRSQPRQVIRHAFIAKLKSSQRQDQVYRRRWHDENHAGKTAKQASSMARQGMVWSERRKGYIPARLMAEEFRRPVRALYGPRIQDHLADPEIYAVLERLSGERLNKQMAHEIEYLLGQRNRPDE